MSVQRILDECIVLRAARLHRVLAQRQDMALRQLGITGPQIVLLAHLQAQGETRAVDLCKELCIEKSTMSRNLKRLLSAGFITIAPRGGRNGRPIAITELGRSKVEAGFPIWEATQRKLLELMTPKERDALALLG